MDHGTSQTTSHQNTLIKSMEFCIFIYKRSTLFNDVSPPMISITVLFGWKDGP